MNKNELGKSALLVGGLLFLTATNISYAANVPAGVVLAAKQELVRGNGTEVAGIDPAKTEGIPESLVIRDLFEGLVNQDAEGKLVPAGALSWTSTDNKTWIFNLRKEAKWSNGEPVTAHDYVYSFRRVVDPKTASPYAWFIQMTTMLNADDIVNGKKSPDTLGVKAIDDYTLEVDLAKKLPYFPQMASHTTMKPVPGRVVEKYGDKWTRPENFVGNGAFVVSKWVVNERMELVPNKYYWDNAHTVLTKVTYLPISDQVTEMNRFLAGEMDFTYEIPTNYIPKLRKEHAEDYAVSPNLCVYYYELNNTKKPFSDVRVRKAFNLAIDRDAISKYVLNDRGDLPAYTFAHRMTTGLKVDMPPEALMTQAQRNAEAVKLLKEAGYDKQNPLKFDLLYNTSENHKKIAIAVAAMLKKTLGAEVTLNNQEWKTYLATRRAFNYQAARAGWCADYNEASSFLSLFQSENTSNSSGYKSAEYDKLVAKALDSSSEQARSEYYRQMEKILNRDTPVAPVYQYVKARLLNPKVGGFPINNPEEKIYSKDLYMIK